MPNLPPPPLCLGLCRAVSPWLGLPSGTSRSEGEARANTLGFDADPANLPPLSSRPPQQIETPAGQHGARHGPMLGAHMPQRINSHSHTNTRRLMHTYKMHARPNTDVTTLSPGGWDAALQKQKCCTSYQKQKYLYTHLVIEAYYKVFCLAQKYTSKMLKYAFFQVR